MDTAMLQNNQLLEIVLDSIPIPIFYKDEKGRYLSCNTAYETLCGLSRKYLSGKSVHEVFDKEYARIFRKMDLKLCRKPGRQVYESTVLDSKGQQHEVIFHEATFLHPHGQVAGIVGVVLDTTELKAAEKKLFGAKTSFNRIFDAIPDLLSVVDRDMRVIYSNWHGGHEYVAEEIRSNNPFCYDAYYPGQGKQCDPCHLLEVFRTGKLLITEKYNPRIGYLEIHAFPVLDESGNVVMAAEYLRNITARKQAENSLLQANQMLEAIINASPLAIIALDTDDRLTLWNDAAEEMFGWKREEVLLKPYPIIPEDRIDEVRKNLKLLHEGELFRSLETRRKRKDGSLIDVSLSTAVIPGPDGRFIGYMAIMSDISEHKRAQLGLRESEERLRQIFEEDEDAALILTPRTYSIVDANAAAVRLYGYSKKEIRKSTPALFMVPEEYGKFTKTFANSDMETSSNKGLFKIDRVDVVSKNRKSIVTSVRGKIIKSQGINYIYCTFRDITEKLSIREERKRFEEKLIQANKMTALGTLASGIAHEINNPNNYILSSTQFLHEAWKDIEQILLEYGRLNGEYTIGGLPDQEAIDVIPKLLAALEEGSGRIKNIVENLKSFARQENQPYLTLLDVNQAVKASMNLLGNQIRKHTDNFILNLDERLPKVQGSFQQIEQVIINLTMNALQALPNKSSGIFISTFHDTNAQQVVIRVRDQGSGIPQELMGRIMEPFFTTKQDLGGTGLGLSICYSIIKKHQGTIECESDPDHGTIFSVKLPVCGADP